MTSPRTHPGFAGLRLEPLPPGPPCRVLTVDVEDWFHSNFRSAPPLADETLPRRVNEGVDRLLEALAAGKATGTFFVLGSVAREHPGLVPRIAAAGHEVGCHGWLHTLVYEQWPAEFRRAVADARKLLQDHSGQPVWGFRAPSWSITERSLWAFDVIAECGFRYDSSVFPAANYLYGIDGAPRAPYRVHTATGAAIVEVPPPVLRLGPRCVGVGGGFYLRLFPLWLQRQALRSYAGRGAPFLVYIHPREFDPGAWPLRLPLSFSEQLIHRFRLRATPGKIMRLMREPGWQAVGDMLRQRGILEAADVRR